MHPIIKYIQNKTDYTSNLVKTIATGMKGNTFHHHYHILYTLRDLIDKDVATYTEIGTFNGGSLCLMLMHSKPVKCISIDPFHLERTNVNITEENIKKFNTNSYEVELTKKFSTDKTLIDELRKRNFKTDILFIDGDHSYKAVIDDFNIYKEFIYDGGFIVFDDYHDSSHSPEVKPAVDDIVKNIIANKESFEIIGSPSNFNRVHPAELPDLNEFILRKL
jgi:predicted O-methyltransferase YrrM